MVTRRQLLLQDREWGKYGEGKDHPEPGLCNVFAFQFESTLR